jgi:BirA family biotin operon repressor/biotin-[acetyl-CoA-carboxylase] ligase
VILRGRQLPNALLLGLAAASAVVATLESHLQIHSVIKWPNDIYIRDRKVGGILVDIVYDGTELKYALVGVGVNMNFRIDKLPSAISEKASTILEHTGHPVDLALFVNAYLEGFRQALDLSPTQLLQRVNTQLWKMEATFRRSNESVTGRIVSVNESGQLMVSVHGGTLRTLDVDFERQ